ncbi:DUF6213 family protein [Streptomyces sp. NPDC048337]|uniref:DUF6213 family protein n=1 Tax=Streptomyces sp. NPDC048337 TaxID=3365535 RepID=UPI003722A200
MNASAPLALGDQLLIPADHLTGLLRRLAAEWLQATDAGETDLDPRTVEALARALSEVADQIDVECIAFMPLRKEGRTGSRGGGPTPR